MTDCPNGAMRDLLPGLLHGRLAPAQRALVEAHVAACADCRAELALLGAMRESLGRANAVDVSTIVGALPAYRAPAGRRWGGWRAAAAVAAIAIGGATLAVATRDADPERSAGVATIPWRDTLLPLPMVPAQPAARVAAQSPVITTRRAVSAAPRELALEHGLADLTDGELSALLAEIESLNALPVVDVESTPLVPASALSSAGGAS